MIDIETRFQNEGFVYKMDVNSSKQLLGKYGIEVYAGALNFITTVAGAIFSSQTFEDSAEAMLQLYASFQPKLMTGLA